MDDRILVRRAAARDVAAFVELTRRFQHFAFGSALALVRDFHRAEDVVQEAFIAAWAALPSLAEPAAFPGWLRSIVRHHAFRMLRRTELELQPLADADAVASEEPTPDRLVEARREATAALAAMAALPMELREPATLFFVHECSHQDIASFLNLPVATVNNRLHAARKRLKEGMLTMVRLHERALPDDFANRIGRLIEARGPVVEALFDPAAMPDILSELALSDEAQRRAVNIQVVQRGAGGLVRGVALGPVDGVPRGATVLASRRPARTPVDLGAFPGIMARLGGAARTTAGTLFETGIKVIDVMCPLVAGGTVVFAGEHKTGALVVSEEMVRRVVGANAPMSFFVLLQPLPTDLPADWSFVGDLKREGYSEGTVGAVQTFFFRCDGQPWNAGRLAMLDAADVVIHLSRERILANVYPAVDVLTSRSRLLDEKAVGDEHAAIAARAREALAALWKGADDCDPLLLERALKLQNYFTQPFFCAEPYTKRSGTTVGLAEALRTCREILDGVHDAVPTDAFYFSGDLAEIKGNIGRQPTFGPVKPASCHNAAAG